MTRRRRALLAGAAVAIVAVAVAVTQSGGGIDDAQAPERREGPTPSSAATTTTTTASTVVPGAPADPTTTGVPATPGADASDGAPAPAPPAPPSRPPTAPAPPTTAAVDTTPVLLAVEAPAPDVPVRPPGGAAIARQRFVTIDAEATVHQLMGARTEPIPGGFRRSGKPVKVLLFDQEPVRLEPVAPYVKESVSGPTTNRPASSSLTTYSWMGTTPALPSLTASLTITQTSSGHFQLTGTITTPGTSPPLQLDHVDGDRYALTQLTTGTPCEPDVVGTPPESTTTTTVTTTTTDPACAR